MTGRDMDLVQALTLHQWQFDNRYFCTCGAEITYDGSYSDDRAMAEHQVAMAKLACPTLSA